jgi:hypothetical protein
MRRINLDSMVDCAGAAVQVVSKTTSPQRVWTPVEGATDRMYWGHLQNSTTFRLYQWPETNAGATTYDRAIDVSTHNNPDCRGGTNNADFIEKSTAYSITGFRMRGWTGQPNRGGGTDVIGFLWNVSADAAHTQAHIHAVTLDIDTKNVTGQPHIFNNDTCMGFPDVAVTERGHPAVVFAHGGHAGGNAAGATGAASVAVLLGDDAAPAGGPFGPYTTVNSGTHNRTDGRYGDYLTIQQHEPCGYYLTAATYALSGGTAASNVRHRYVQFGRGRDRLCWNAWSGQP